MFQAINVADGHIFCPAYVVYELRVIAAHLENCRETLQFHCRRHCSFNVSKNWYIEKHMGLVEKWYYIGKQSIFSLPFAHYCIQTERNPWWWANLNPCLCSCRWCKNIILIEVLCKNIILIEVLCQYPVTATCTFSDIKQKGLPDVINFVHWCPFWITYK